MFDIENNFVVTLRQKLSEYRFTFNDEVELQDRLEEFFQRELYRYEREKALGASDRPDFLVEVNAQKVAAIEVKTQGGISSHLRQMRRYIGYQQICAVVLVCVKPVEVPTTLSGKPTYCISLWRQRGGM